MLIRPKTEKKNAFRFWLAAAPGFVFSLLVATVFLSEWFKIGVVADTQTIDEYHFGSEAMIHHGGWRYQSAEMYATSALVEGIVALSIAALFTLPAARRSWRLLIWPYSALVAVLVVGHIS